MEQMLQDARSDLLYAQRMLAVVRRHAPYGRMVRAEERTFLAALDRVWAVQCMLNPSLS
jgi:hypothetical protein